MSVLSIRNETIGMAVPIVNFRYQGHWGRLRTEFKREFCALKRFYAFWGQQRTERKMGSALANKIGIRSAHRIGPDRSGRIEDRIASPNRIESDRRRGSDRSNDRKIGSAWSVRRQSEACWGNLKFVIERWNLDVWMAYCCTQGISGNANIDISSDDDHENAHDLKKTIKTHCFFNGFRGSSHLHVAAT